MAEDAFAIALRIFFRRTKGEKFQIEIDMAAEKIGLPVAHGVRYFSKYIGCIVPLLKFEHAISHLGQSIRFMIGQNRRMIRRSVRSLIFQVS